MAPTATKPETPFFPDSRLPGHPLNLGSFGIEPKPPALALPHQRRAQRLHVARKSLQLRLRGRIAEAAAKRREAVRIPRRRRDGLVLLLRAHLARRTLRPLNFRSPHVFSPQPGDRPSIGEPKAATGTRLGFRFFAGDLLAHCWVRMCSPAPDLAGAYGASVALASRLGKEDESAGEPQKNNPLATLQFSETITHQNILR